MSRPESIHQISEPNRATNDEPSAAATNRPCKENFGWRRIVRNFTPSWFAVNMGTGIVSILLHQLPYNAHWLRYLSYVFFGLNVIMFFVFLGVTVLRYVLYPDIWTVMIAHPSQSLFLGCFPMGLATIINMMIFCCEQWGDWLVYLTWTLWWIDVWLSVATCISMPLIVMERHRPELPKVTAALLLPIVPVVVAASSGGIVAEALPDPGHAYTTIIVSYILWGIGECCTACVLALYFHRLTIHSMPSKEVVISTFLPVGPLGQGGFAIQQLGRVALKILPQTHAFSLVDSGAVQAAETLYYLGTFLGMIMWGFGVVWTCFAFISIGSTRAFPFNMGWWGLTFPLGTLATCTGLLAETLDSSFFEVSTMILSLTVVLFWIVVAVETARLTVTGAMFVAPCLNDLKQVKENPSDPGALQLAR